jgi:hypothetical protein
MELNELVIGVIVLLFIMMLWHHMKNKKCSHRWNHYSHSNGCNDSHSNGWGYSYPDESQEIVILDMPMRQNRESPRQESVGNLNDLTIRGCGETNMLHKNTRNEVMKAFNAKNNRWYTDMDIQIDPQQATVDDMVNGRLTYGNGLVNETTSWSSNSLKGKVASKHIGHGHDVLTATDYSSEVYSN